MTASNLEFFLSHRAALVQCAARHVGSSAWAEDVVQEAYLRFAAAAETPAANITRPLGYLRRTVRNLALDWAQHLYPERRHPAAHATVHALEAVPRSNAVPEVAALRREELRLIEDALEELPPRTRRAFELRHFDELTLDEIRVTLGISTSLAHKLVQHARSHCAARLRQS
jgi:RNA polymerase sigma factor (sigma-70 family)